MDEGVGIGKEKGAGLDGRGSGMREREGDGDGWMREWGRGEKRVRGWMDGGVGRR